MRTLAERHQALSAEIKDLDAELDRLTAKTAARLVALLGSAPTAPARCWWPPATTLTGCARSRPSQCCAGPLRSRPSRARPSVTAPDRGGDRRAGAALYRIVMVRLRYDPRTRDYMARRLTQGKSRREVIRCRKRYVAREVFAALCQINLDKPAAA